MSNSQTPCQLLLNRMAENPALKEKILSMGQEEFLRLLQEGGIGDATPQKAEQILAQLKAAAKGNVAELSDESLADVAGGVIVNIIK